jgi:hypothetical protein
VPRGANMVRGAPRYPEGLHRSDPSGSSAERRRGRTIAFGGGNVGPPLHQEHRSGAEGSVGHPGPPFSGCGCRCTTGGGALRDRVSRDHPPPGSGGAGTPRCPRVPLLGAPCRCPCLELRHPGPRQLGGSCPSWASQLARLRWWSRAGKSWSSRWTSSLAPMVEPSSLGAKGPLILATAFSLVTASSSASS